MSYTYESKDYFKVIKKGLNQLDTIQLFRIIGTPDNKILLTGEFSALSGDRDNIF